MYVRLLLNNTQVNLLMEYAPLDADMTEATCSALRAYCDARLEKSFKFSDAVQGVVFTEFFRGRRAMPVAEYNKCVHVQERGCFVCWCVHACIRPCPCLLCEHPLAA
mgnify:CR=1 FL=1